VVLKTGYGKVLKDVLYYFKTHTKHSNKYIELQTNCRHELAESKILEFSEGFITEGEVTNELKTLISSGNPDISKGFRIHFWETENDLYKLINEEFDFLCDKLGITGNTSIKLNKLFKLKEDGSFPADMDYQLEYFQILSPYKSDFYGAGQVNDYIQRDYKPDLELCLVNDWFKQSDKIIRTKNYYKDGKLILSNGSIGLVRNDSKPTLYFPELNEPMPVYGENGLKSSTELEHFDLAYAITVHKAQGSGFDHCFFILPKKPGLLSKELIYTALTRSRSSVTLFIQGDPKQTFEKSVLEKARLRSYTESRKTTLLLDKPFRYYALEADGKFIESRVELLIYQALKEAQKQYGEDNLLFEYEEPPVIDGKTLPMKTDFSLLTSKGFWYWEHLGRLGNKNYEWTWHNVKIKSYEQYGAKERLITTHERNGINPEKIKEIIALIMEDQVTTEDPTNKYSLHHFSLR
jgi:exodeoxyribonuclease V alpha subunit